MAQVLPATVEELNMRVPSTLNNTMMFKKGFEDKPFINRFKREVSLPNGVENWNISNIESYLNFDDVVANEFDFPASPDDRTVPGGDQRARCDSMSSASSFVEEKPSPMYNPIKPFNSLLHMGIGSTCVSFDHSYFNSSSPLDKGLDLEETYANIDTFFQEEVQEIKAPEPLLPPFSPLPSTSNDDIFELTSRSFSSEESMESLSIRTTKRPFDVLSEDVFLTKQAKHELGESSGAPHYHEVRRKNNLASKNCRKTRKEKQKEMEEKVSKLEEERESLKSKVNLLEQMIEAHKKCLLTAIGLKSST